MKNIVTSSIDNFITELKKRIQLLSGTKITENITDSNYDKIISLLSKYTTKSPESLETSDIKQINKKTLEKILDLIGENPDSIEYIISRLDESDDNIFYDKIREHLLSYIVEYRNIDNNQSSMINEKIALYQKYIDLFKKKSFNEAFTEINELLKVMTEIGFPDEDKWRILEYIAQKNNDTIEEKDIDLVILVNNAMDSVMPYLEDKEVLTLIQKELETMSIDVDLIPTVSEYISKRSGLDIRIATNVVAASIASSMLENFEKMDSAEAENQLREEIFAVLEFVEPIHNDVVYRARDIKANKEDFYLTSKINGLNDEEIKRYIDTPLTLIEEETKSREEAIDLKELPVIESILETLDTIDRLDVDSEDYKKCCIVLDKLIEQFLLLEDKKDEKLRRIN